MVDLRSAMEPAQSELASVMFPDFFLIFFFHFCIGTFEIWKASKEQGLASTLFCTIFETKSEEKEVHLTPYRAEWKERFIITSPRGDPLTPSILLHLLSTS